MGKRTRKESQKLQKNHRKQRIVIKSILMLSSVLQKIWNQAKEGGKRRALSCRLHLLLLTIITGEIDGDVGESYANPNPKIYLGKFLKCGMTTTRFRNFTATPALTGPQEF